MPTSYSEALERALGEIIAKARDDATTVLAEVRTALEKAEARIAEAETMRGPPGPPGQLPIAKEWTDTVHYEGDVRTHEGALWQATRDTGRAPPHDDWICLAAPGADAREMKPCGTYEPGGTYHRLNVVALNGASFVAKKDDPGPCPGEDWQLMAQQGKRGLPGEPGKPGLPGRPGPAVKALRVDDNGMLTLVNADGSTVDCDLYPLLSRIASTRP